MPLLDDAALTGLREALEITLTHTCVRTPMVPSATDSENNMPLVPGTPATVEVCRYETVQRVVRDEGGVTVVAIPTLTAAATGPITVGDQITLITDQLGVVLHAGPLRVERVLDDTAGLGASLLPVYELRAAEVGRW